MPCKLTRSGFNWSAPSGSVVTLKLISDSTLISLTQGQYDGQAIPVQDNAISFTVGEGAKELSLAFAGPTDVGEGRPPKGRPTTPAILGRAKIIEDCGNGQSQIFFDANELEPVLLFTIVGV